MKRLAMMLVMASLALFTSCGEKPEPTPEEGDHWSASDSPYGININPYNGDIIITTDGEFTTSGDCYVFDKNLKKRIGPLTLGSMPSTAAALNGSRLLILNEGSWGANDAGVSLVDVSSNTAVVNWFSNNNSRGLGDVAQDLKIYGNKAYAAVTFSNSIEIIDLATGTSNQLSTTSNAQNPRYLAPYGGCIYATCYSPASVIRIDTLSQSITGSCTLGEFNPEGICALNGRLYVCSSNISDENYNYSYDNKLYVVDIMSLSVVDSITVGYNPAKAKVLDNNHIVVNTWGNYADDAGGTYIVDVETKNAVALDKILYNFDVFNGDIYGYTSPYVSMKFYKINGTTHTATEILAAP